MKGEKTDQEISAPQGALICCISGINCIYVYITIVVS